MDLALWLLHSKFSFETKYQYFLVQRDLRLVDNIALSDAIESKNPLLLIYLFEPIVINDQHTSKKHINFIKESILDLNNSLKKFDTHIHVYECELINFFKNYQKNTM